MAIEIDSFKDLFIKIGRSGAEAIIKKVARVLIDAVRKEDTISRSGVASFVVSMPLTQGENALELAERICQTVEAFRATLDGHRIKITVSVGVCVVEPENNANVDLVLNIADEALYRATQLGKSQLYKLSMNDYQRHMAEQQKQTMSIDALLEKIKNGEQGDVLPCLDVALERMAPLLILLSNEQKQRVITYR
jgi:diguanylate cyclase (GGDEF)-like protein